MAAPRKEILSLYRLLLKELRYAYPKGKHRDAAAYQYVRKEFRDNNPTSERFCRNPIEMAHIARTYLCYIQSVKTHDELHSQFKGGGERSLESTANLVGLNLPKLHYE